MTVLRIAAAVCALLTITLNAHHGYTSADQLEYAVLFAALYAALDLAKCAAIPATIALWRARHRLMALGTLVLFIALFANSAWNAVTQVTIVKSAAKAGAVADTQTRIRTEATHRRLAGELATAQQSATFAATAACTLPKSNEAKSFCTNVAKLKTDLAAAERALAGTKPIDAAPQNTLLAVYFPNLPASSLTFALAVVPVLLAEIVGSFGFAIAALANTPPKAPRTRQERFRAWLAGHVVHSAPNQAAPVLEAPAAIPVRAPHVASNQPTAQVLTWSKPVA